MNLKKIKTIGIFITFGLCFINHFIYSWFPNPLTSIFFPVNESIWEHMKMMTTSIIMWSIIEFYLLKKYRINHNNYWISVFFTCIISIIIFLIIYYPIYLKIGESFLINITVLFITIYISYIINYLIINKNHIMNDYIGTIGIILIYIIFGILTYYPIKNELFIDKTNNKYGINNYLIK